MWVAKKWSLDSETLQILYIWMDTARNSCLSNHSQTTKNPTTCKVWIFPPKSKSSSRNQKPTVDWSNPKQPPGMYKTL